VSDATSAYFELTKPRITWLVVLTAGAGFLAGSPLPPDIILLVHTLFGTALVAGGTNALNQWWERDVDARMRRTMHRPLPSGRLTPARALACGLAIAGLGIGELVLFVNVLTGLLAAFTLASYVLVYTPLKRRTALATIVGAVPGALPILGGWTAATGGTSPAAWALFATLFLWQLPHFYALAWLYRDDYRRAGLAIVSVYDADGRRTGRGAVLYAAALLPVSVLPTALDAAGGWYAAAALALGAWLLGAAAAFASPTVFDRRGASWTVLDRPSLLNPAARRLLLTSVAYLPLLLLALVADRLVA
jgi:protoheme IX farnesyltransferase